MWYVFVRDLRFFQCNMILYHLNIFFLLVILTLSAFLAFLFIWYINNYHRMRTFLGSSLMAQLIKKQATMRKTQVWSLGWECQPTPVFLPGESLGQRSQVDTVVHGITELDPTERLTLYFHFRTFLKIKIFILKFFCDVTGEPCSLKCSPYYYIKYFSSFTFIILCHCLFIFFHSC